MGRNLEQEIKDYVLDNEHFFGNLGDNIVLSEKSLGYSYKRGTKKTVADLLILSMNHGVIGVEIKTEYDDLTRLKRQLEGYSLVCDIVYVVCHDKHIDGVEERIKRYGHEHVGIISYTEFKGRIIGGKYREAKDNPKMSLYHTMNTLLWKKDVVKILQGAQYPSKVSDKALGRDTPEDGRRGEAKSFTSRMKKSSLIRNVIARFGKKESMRILVKYYIERGNTEKVLNIRHFNPTTFKDRE